MMGQRIVKNLSEGAELGNVRSEKLQRRARARKIGKMIRRCKAETKALKKLDDEQKEYWKECEEVLLINDPIISPGVFPRSRAAKFQVLVKAD